MTLLKVLSFPTLLVLFHPSMSRAEEATLSECLDQAPAFADTLIRATGASGTGYGNPQNALNGAKGGGKNAGSLDVFSLNFTSDGTLIAAFSQGAVCNGPGADITVFENGFYNMVSGALFFEPVVVSLSSDCITFEAFPHEYRGTTSPIDVVSEKNWVGFAGMTPAYYNESTFNFTDHGVDPLDPMTAGGDAFDIDNLPDTEEGLKIKALGARCVQITAAPKLGFPNSPNAFGGFADIDGIYAKRFLP